MGKKLSLQDTADELGISIRSVRRLITDGELRAYKIGKKSLRIDVDDIAAALKPIVPSQWSEHMPPQFVRAEEIRKAARDNHVHRRARKAARDKRARTDVA